MKLQENVYGNLLLVLCLTVCGWNGYLGSPGIQELMQYLCDQNYPGTVKITLERELL